MDDPVDTFLGARHRIAIADIAANKLDIARQIGWRLPIGVDLCDQGIEDPQVVSARQQFAA